MEKGAKSWNDVVNVSMFLCRIKASSIDFIQQLKGRVVNSILKTRKGSEAIRKEGDDE